MCSRYSLTSPPEAVRAYFRHINEIDYPPRYNIAPTQPVAIVRNDVRGKREIVLVRWGLVPSWVKTPGEFTTIVNARSETAAEKPSFRSALRHRRCLVPADSYYEWTGTAVAKRPHMIKPVTGGPMALAGLVERWLGADGSEFGSMAILTTSANSTTAVIHDRMPVILAPEEFDHWLDCRGGTSMAILPLLRPALVGLLDVVAVSPKLNNVRNQGPKVQEPVEAPSRTLFGGP